MKTSTITKILFLSVSVATSCSDPPEAGPTGSSGTGGQTTSGASGAAGSNVTGGGAGTGGSAGTSGSGGSGGSGMDGSAGADGADEGGVTCIPGVLGHPDCTQPAPPTYPDFTLYLVEDFSAPIDLVNDPIWTYSDGGQSEGDQRFVKDAITFADGNMIITAKAANVPASPSCAEFLPNVPNSGQVANKPHTSGEFRSKYNNFRYGRYEASFESPQGQPEGAGGCIPGATARTVCSNFLATLFVFRTPKSRGLNGGGQWREIDIEVQGDYPTSLGTNLVHQDNNPSGGYNATFAEVIFAYPHPAGSEAMALPAGFNNRMPGLHTYAFEWTPTTIKWFVDGVLIRVKTSGTGLPIPTESAHLMANLWFFPSNAAFGNPALNQYPISIKYDFIRFYRWNQETTYPKANPATELPAEDLISRNNAEDGKGACP